MNPLSGIQSALNPQSPQAQAIADLAWLLIGGAAVLFALVMTLAALALWRRPRWLAGRRAVIAGGVALPGVVLLALLVHSVGRMGAGAAAAEAAPALRIEVVGRQWWWQVRYLAGDAVEFVTANELRVPVGRSVEVLLRSEDVLHSFWVPNLAGKLDLVPGRVNRLRFTVATAGTWRGQCAEYCGGPHALMGFYVVGLPEPDFARWRARQREDARTQPPAPFLARCAVCHTVRGTPAAGTLGPDLTHVGGRVALAAAALPMERDALVRWIAASQQVKPGNLMPAFSSLSGDELLAIADYLLALE